MTLSVSFLSGWPPQNTTFAESKVPSFYPTGVSMGGTNSPAPTISAPYSYTLSTTSPTAGQYTYVQSGTQYVAGIIDREGVVPSRIFLANNGSGSYQSGTVALPTLNYIVQQQTVGWDGTTEYGGYKVVLNATAGSLEDGVYPLGYTEPWNAQLGQGQTGPTAWTLQGGAYTNANAATGYPNPQMVFYVSMSAALLLSTTQY